MLDVLFEDAHCLAVSKPAGLLTQGRIGGEPSLEDLVRRYLDPDRPLSVYLGTIHRLDRPVTGVVLWGKSPKAARRLASQFAERKARKRYWAVVAGQPSLPSELWEDWLCLEKTGLWMAQVCHPETPRARQAVTEMECLGGLRRPEGTIGLRLSPRTGRTHQLRVQTSCRGMPILGDFAYGSSLGFSSGIALHARELTVKHPSSGEDLTIVADLPPSWKEAGIESIVGD